MRFIFLAALFVANLFAWTFAFPSHNLHVSFLNVGQGDAVFIEGPTGVQVLVDGGPSGGGVLRELGMRMPFFDRSLDAIVATHPDADHITGLVDVLERYQVGTFLEPGIPNSTKISLELVAGVQKKNLKDILARRGMRLILGGGAYADVLYPDADVSRIKETNSGSIVLHVFYGKTSFLLTGDLPAKQEKYVVARDGKNLKSDVLKVGHHGSKSSSAPTFVRSVSPQYAVFSRGCKNRYGHPAPIVVQLFQTLKIKTFDTCADGTVTFVSDGRGLAVLH